MYSFTHVDEFNPHIDQVYALLLELSMEMEAKGFVPETKVAIYDLKADENMNELC